MENRVRRIPISHRATRTGFIFRLVRNLAIVVSGLGCLITALGLLGLVLVMGRAIQIGVEGRISTHLENHLNSALPILMPAGVLILFGLGMLLAGLIVNWLVTTPVYKNDADGDEAQKE